MKKMKKIVASVLAASMVMSFTVWADTEGKTAGYNKEGVEVTNPTASSASGTNHYTDIVSLDLAKLYKDKWTPDENGELMNPAETFEFYIQPYSVSNAGKTTGKDGKTVDIDVNNMPMFCSDEEYQYEGNRYPKYSISYLENEVDDEAGDKNVVRLELPTYETVGIYTYKISEIAGNTAGVTYDNNPLYLKVTVIEQDDLVRIAALHYENVDGSKVENITNTYSAGSLDVTKTVTGNMGDQTKYFEVKVKFKSPENLTVYSDIYYTADDDGKYNDSKLVAVEADTEGWTGEKEVTIKLKHDETIKFTNIPFGVTYEVRENDYTTDGYDEPVYVYTGVTEDTISKDGETISKYDIDKGTAIGESVDITTGSVTLRENCYMHQVKITNNKESEVDTGIILDSAPYILLLAVAALGMFAVVNKKREEEF